MAAAAPQQYTPSSRLKNDIAAGDDLTEYLDSPEELAEKVAILADLVRASGYTVAFTGAGISHSSGIPTYRGPEGLWTRRDQGLPPPKGVSLEEAVPTAGHMALVELVNKGVFKHVVSTNVDGLHRRSGLTRVQMSELHGNIYMEVCTVCESEYQRKQRVSTRKGHLTGNKCEFCAGQLFDNIIHFNENLPEKELAKAMEHSVFMELALVIGTSMKVHPACDLPLYTLERGGRMVIANLQRTQYDDLAFLRIFGQSDVVLTMLAEKLGHEVPQFLVDHIKG